MATGKISAKLVTELNMCWSGPKSVDTLEQASRGGDGEYSVDEILGMQWISYEDTMFAVCRPEVIESELLYSFAGTIAREQLAIIAREWPEAHKAFEKAVDACLNGDSTDKAIACEKTQQAIVASTNLSPATIGACKSVRACVKPDPGHAALGAALHASGHSIHAKDSQRKLLARMFKESLEA